MKRSTSGAAIAAHDGQPLRADWANAQAAALLLAHEADALDGKKRQERLAEARAAIHRFHHLCAAPGCWTAQRRGADLPDKLLLEQGLVSVLRTLHDDLDAAVLQTLEALGRARSQGQAGHTAWRAA